METVQVEFDEISGEFVIPLPDDLCERLNWKVGDELTITSFDDGKFEIKKKD